ncbi:toprim domain-containing protein [Methylomagnum sp.]
MDEELERFKRSIDLVNFAEAYGFRIIRRRGPIVEMRHEQDGDRIDITLHEADGHPVFKSWNQAAQGSIIDFVMHRDRCTLGKARVILRHWTPAYLPSARSSPAPRPAPREPLNRVALAATWRGFRPYAGGYLEARGLSAATLATASDRVKLDERGNVAFRHDDLEGLSGWEIKNRGFQGFATGGKKALFALRVGFPKGEAPPRLVVTESALDALSFHQYDSAPALLLSFGGGLSNDQRALLAHVLTKYPAAAVLAATDSDEQGDLYAATIAAIRPDAIRAKSPTGKDWNDSIRPAPAPRKDRHRPFNPATVPP